MKELEIIQVTVEEFLDVKITKSRKREIVYAKRFYAALAKESTGYSLDAIGRQLGLDHATILHHVRTHQNLFDTYKEYRIQYRKCQLKVAVLMTKEEKEAYKAKYHFHLSQTRRFARLMRAI